MKKSANRTYAPYIVAALFLLILAGTGAYNASQCNGKWVFALDDSYIHLAMARTLAEHGVWGVTPDQFSATSSAPLYTLLMAGTFLTGMGGEAWAWILSALGGAIAAFLLTRRISEFFPNAITATVIGLVCGIAIWLPEIMTTGMEHTLHISAVLIVILLLERVLSQEPPKRASLWLAVAVFVASGLRYETIFLMPPICWLLWQEGRKQTALVVLGCCLLPPIALGVLQFANGAMLFPNSVLLKGVDLDNGVTGHLTRLIRQLDSPSSLALLAIATLWLFDRSRRSEKWGLAKTAPSIIFIGALLAHATLARPDRRYLGYLLALGLWAAIPALSHWFALGQEWLKDSRNADRNRGTRIIFAALIIVVLIPFSPQFLDLGRLALLGQDIYAQQVQTARFLSTYYPDECVGLNDIGTTSWAGKNSILDLRGLANDKVARMRLSGELGPSQLEQLARERNVKVVAIYSNWFLRGKGLPEQWKIAARWQIPVDIDVNAASNAVDFYATSSEGLESLRRNMQEFSSHLPANVTILK